MSLSRLARWLAKWTIFAILAFYGFVTAALLAMKGVAPPTTAVQAERRVSAWVHRTAYHKSYEFVPLAKISEHLQRAVLAAEDARFYSHHGFDWKEIQIAASEDAEDGKRRGASTITQQLVKNLFLSTQRSWIRKGVEFTIVPLAEAILGKQRILELYLNVVEWGPGVFGAEAAAERWYGARAAALTRDQAIQLAAILPAPLHRRPGRMGAYAEKIAGHMRENGW